MGLFSISVLSAKVGAANQQRCCSTDMFPQWRLSPLTLHTQTLLRKPFVPTTPQPIGPALPVPSANLTSSGENKWSPPPVVSTIPQQPTEAQTPSSLLFIVPSSCCTSLLTPCCCLSFAHPHPPHHPPRPSCTNPCFVLINLIL